MPTWTHGHIHATNMQNTYKCHLCGLNCHYSWLVTTCMYGREKAQQEMDRSSEWFSFLTLTRQKHRSYKVKTRGLILTGNSLMLYSVWTVACMPACPCMCMPVCVHLCACMHVCAYAHIYQELFIMSWEFTSCESVCL